MFEQLVVPFRPPPPLNIPISDMTREQILGFLVDRHRRRSQLDGEIVQACARFAELTPPQRSGISIGDGAAEELALELSVSPLTAAKHLHEAQTLAIRLPATVSALTEGELDIMRAKAVHDYTADLDDDQAAQVEKRVLSGGKRDNLTRFKHALNREVIRADPRGAEKRRLSAKCRRDVTRWHRPDGTSTVTVTLQPHEAELTYQHIDELARRAGGPRRNLGQARADVFVDLLQGKDNPRPPVSLHVMVPMTTLMGLNQEPGEISGIGPITADYARELAHHATWRRILTDPAGQVMEVSRRRFASPALRRHLQVRDRTCRQPGCTVPALRCEADHSTTYALGGATGVGNLAMLCKRHNLMRQRASWRIDHVMPGVLAFTTPSRRTAVAAPAGYDLPPF
ncbi:HNH endonuclease signature motif containing protein [Kibdelosporangium phytohabitans]|uniref:DUF222 domain-containing protein n=1 Tax=Kibdelosporangium phytohabitans TaxID=860235 RepID=A0A0N9I8G0_9PSEU|nr:HNH endonuclease signature motif containing protein [Kibdelosporangium phytohabitans]ALG12540.1 hypothetical protein AOZ06_41840 [Kibdelosporangium phytohabitans]MBE1464149.1 hypothetical protein [Kibdelosporangium phytohabitans]